MRIPGSNPTGIGKRRQMAITAADLAEQAPQRMRERLAPHVDEYVDSLLTAMRTPTFEGQFGPISNPAYRTAMQLIPQILKAVGASVELTINLWSKMGVQDEAHGRRLIDQALEAEGMDRETAWRLSEQFAQEYRRENGLPELVESRAQITEGANGNLGQ